MRQTKIKKNINIADQNVNIIDGNGLIANVFDDNQIKACVDQINELPDSIDIKRVMELKKQVDSGNYDFDSKLGKVLDAMVEESQDPNPISYPLFDH